MYLKPGIFWEPDLQGFEGPHAPIYCFLVSHGNRHVIFDLGLRTDWQNLPPKIVQMIQDITLVTGNEKDIASILDDDTSGLNVRTSDVEAVIWSHPHFDHIGDPARFPASTELVVGPGVKATSWPGYPSNPDASVLDSDIAGRTVREITFEGSGPRIAGLEAHDFFGDGSFYLLNAPGHATGHLCGLARTTANPPSFVFFGADACHHPGVLRPSQYSPLPQGRLLGSQHNHGGCMGDVLARLSSWKDAREPFFRLAPGTFPDYEASVDTVGKIQELDAAGSVMVVLAHDSSLGDRLPLFPEKMNEWQRLGIRDATRWAFCKELEHVEPSKV